MVCGFINSLKYVFYVPLNFGLGDFLFGMGVKEIEGFAKRYEDYKKCLTKY